jgi:hypothetical protein
LLPLPLPELERPAPPLLLAPTALAPDEEPLPLPPFTPPLPPELPGEPPASPVSLLDDPHAIIGIKQGAPMSAATRRTDR